MLFSLRALAPARPEHDGCSRGPRLRRGVAVLATATAALTGAGIAGPAVTAAHATVRTSHSTRLSSIESHAVAIASKQRGKPYRYGAAGPHAFDCSGLVQYSYRRSGLHLPRTAQQQYWSTRHIRHAKMRPGDLIFFALAGGGRHRIDHVGIYAGRHVMWVARHPGTRIQRETLWTNRFWVGRPRG